MLMTPSELEQQLVEWRDKAAELGAQWAVYQGQYKSCENRKNDYLSELTLKAEGKSMAEKEKKARTSIEWMNFRCELTKAEAAALKLKIEYEVACRSWETIRSLLSSKNAERRSYV